MELNEARRALEQLDRNVQSLLHLQFLIDQALTGIESDPKGEANAMQQTALKGYMLLYEACVIPISPYIANLEFAPKTPETGGSLDDTSILTLGLSGNWQSFEFSTLLGSLSYVHNVATLDKKLRGANPDYRYEKGQTRYAVVNKAKVHYYLEKNEELRIRRLHISSPGIIDLITNNFANGAYIAAVLLSIHQLPNFVNKIMSLWFRYRKEAFAIKKMEREDRTDELVCRFIDVELQKYLQEDDRNAESLLEILQGVKNISVDRKLAKSDVLLDRTLHSIATLSNLDKRGKFRVSDRTGE